MTDQPVELEIKGDVRILRPQRGDSICLRFPMKLTDVQKARIIRIAQEIFAWESIAVIDSGGEIDIVRSES